MNKILQLVMVAALAATADAATLTLLTGDIAGAPGETIGWDFQFTNETSFYVVITGVDFSPNNGVFTGFLPTDPAQIWLLQAFEVIYPHTTSTQSFDALLHTGIGPYLVNDFQPIGDVSSGAMGLTYDAYVDDPNTAEFDPDDSRHLYGQRATAPASVTVQAQPAPVPEPSTILLAGLALSILTLVCRQTSKTG